jgi:DNA polymerase V
MQPQSDHQSIRNTPGVAVHDGFPNPAADERLQGLDLNQLLITHSISTFLMRIEGNEWQDIGIFAGDIAIVDKALDPRPGDLVVWWSDGTFAVSECHRLPKDAIIWGIVTSVIHRFREVV